MDKLSLLPPVVQARLVRIAGALGLSVSVLLEGEPPRESEPDDTVTLLRLWAAIDDPQGRRRVLNHARREAERSGLDGSG